MSLGNTNDKNNKNHNYPYQHAVLTLLKALSDAQGPAITGYSLESTQQLIQTAVQSDSFYGNNANFVSGATTDITNQTATTVIAAPAAGLRLYVTQILVTNSHATVGTFVNITEETSGTILYTGYAAPAGGGFSLAFNTPLKLPTTSKALQVTCVTTGANVRASASGYKAA